MDSFEKERTGMYGGNMMINWVIGGVIFCLTVNIIVRMIIRMRKSESGCCGRGCANIKQTKYN